MTREEARNELESRLHQPLDRILPGELYALLCDQYILRREAEARVKELEQENATMRRNLLRNTKRSTRMD